MVVMGACGSGGGISKGDKHFQQEEYELAIKEYQSALNKGKEPAKANYGIAEAYRRSNRIQEAEQYYKGAIDNKTAQEDAAFYYGMALKANGKYNEAAAQFNSYAASGKNSELTARARELAKSAEQATQIKSAKRYKVQGVDGLNSTSSDYAPVMRGNELVFTSARAGKTYKGNGEGFHDLFTIKFDDPKNMSGGTATAFSNVLNNAEMHDAAATFTKDGKTVVFARSNEGTKDGGKNVNLYISRLTGSTWSAPQQISVNGKETWDSTPMFSPDGKTLYFSSNRPGGHGGNDLYKTTMDASGRFSNPENLGPTINSAGNESFPYVAEDGTLYFASDGHPGMGMLDVFKMEGGKPVNMGADVNSNADDFGILVLSRTTGLISSNRAGGKGGDDIYRYELIVRDVNYVAEVTVTDVNTKAKLPMTKVTLVDAQGNKLQEQTTDASGIVRFKLDSASTYSVMGERDQYFALRENATTVGKRPKNLTSEKTEVTVPVRLAMKKIDQPIALNNIFYDFDKADIRPAAAIVLDSLADILKNTPGITVELGSHTDARGVDIYNLDLSQRRAQSAVDYLVSKGVDKNRITAKGYGETQLVIKNARTEAQHQVNRRTEVKVTKVDGETISSPTPKVGQGMPGSNNQKNNRKNRKK